MLFANIYLLTKICTTIIIGANNKITQYYNHVLHHYIVL